MSQSSDAPLAGPTPPDSFDSLIRAAAAAPAVIPRLPTLPEGYQVGRYRIVRELGRGGMGSVFEAVHRTSGKRVALKIVREGLALTPTLRQRIEREARLVTAIDHPGVVPVLDVFDSESGWPVLVLELLRGETLADWLRRERRSVPDVARVIADVVAIVAAAHAASVVHRDLKPENVFLAERAEGAPLVRLLDFGIACSLVPDDEGRVPLTVTGALVGTPRYMAPEQLFGERDIDEGADVWALGVLLYEAISGKRPIEGANVGQIVRRLGEDGVGKLEPGICPEALRDVIHRMLEPDCSRRFRDLHELESLLRRCARGQLDGSKPRIGAAVVVLACCVPAIAGFIAVFAPDALPRASAPERAAPSAPQASEAGPRELTFATLFSRTSTQGRLLEAWRRAVNLRSGGRLDVNVKWTRASGIRGSERALLSRLRTGQVDGATVGAKTLPVIYPAVTALAFPGVVDTWAKVDGIRESLRDVIGGPPGKAGHRLLAWQDEGCQRFMSRGRPVRRASDLRNRRIALAEDDALSALLLSRMPGSVPVVLGESELSDALRGTRAGVSVTLATAGDAERLPWTRYFDHMTTMPVVCTSGALVIRSEVYERLPPDLQATLDHFSERLESEGAPRARQEDMAASRRLRKSLVAVDPTEAERREWQRFFSKAAGAQRAVPKALVDQVVALGREIDALE